MDTITAQAHFSLGLAKNRFTIRYDCFSIQEQTEFANGK